MPFLRTSEPLSRSLLLCLLVSAVHADPILRMFEAGSGDEAVAQVASELAILRTTHEEPHEELAQGLLRMANVLREAGRPDEALQHYQDAVFAFDAALGAEHARAINARLILALEFAELNRLHEAQDELARVCTLYEDAGWPSEERQMQVLDAWSRTLGRLGRFKDGLQRAQDALALEQQQPQVAPVSLVEKQQRVGEMLFQLGRYAEAEQAWLRALKTCRASLQPGHAFATDALLQLSSLYYTTRRMDRMQSAVDAAFARVKDLPPPQPPAFGRCQNAFGLIAARADQLDRAEQHFDQALDVLERAGAGESRWAAEVLENQARLAIARNQIVAAERLTQRASRIYARQYTTDHPINASGFELLARIREIRGDAARASALWKRKLQVEEWAFGSRHVRVEETWFHYAEFLMRQSDLSGTEQALENALGIAKARLGPDHPNLVKIHVALADVYRAQGFPKKALAVLSRNERLLAAAATDDPQKARGLATQRFTSMKRLADQHYAMREYEEAEGLFRRMLAMEDDIDDPLQIGVSAALRGLIGTLVFLDRLPESEQYFLYAFGIAQRYPDRFEGDLQEALLKIAAMYEEQKRYREAEVLHRSGVNLAMKAFGKGDLHVALGLHQWGEYSARRGRPDIAEGLHLAALDIRSNQLGELHPDVVESLLNLARALQDQGAYPEAEQRYEECLEVLKEMRQTGRTQWKNCAQSLLGMYRKWGPTVKDRAERKAIKEKADRIEDRMISLREGR